MNELLQKTLSQGTLISYALFDALATIVALGIYFQVIPEFAMLFRNFGADLPLLTELYLARPGPVWTVIFLTLAIQQVALVLVFRGGSIGAQRVFIGALLVDVLTVPLGIIAIYLPIFTLGQAI